MGTFGKETALTFVQLDKFVTLPASGKSNS